MALELPVCPAIFRNGSGPKLKIAALIFFTLPGGFPSPPFLTQLWKDLNGKIHTIERSAREGGYLSQRLRHDVERLAEPCHEPSAGGGDLPQVEIAETE